MFYRVGDRDSAALRKPEQRKPINAGGIDNGLHIADPRIKRKLADIPVRQTVAAGIVAKQRERFRELKQEITTNRQLPIVLQMTHPMPCSHERWSRPKLGIGQPNTVRRAAVPNFLLKVGVGQESGRQRSFAVKIDTIDLDRPRNVPQVLTAEFAARDFDLAFNEVQHVARNANAATGRDAF